jgi:hypothetical protein
MRDENRRKFLVLVPHRDVRVVLHNYREKLIKEGVTGVYCFPLAAPVAELSRSLTDAELKQIAYLLRETVGEGKINGSEITIGAFSANEEDQQIIRTNTNGNMALFGHRLNLEIPGNILGDNTKINTLFSPIIIGGFLIPGFSQELKKDNEQQAGAFQTFDLAFWREKFDCFKPLYEKLAFRAAAVANMDWQLFQEGEYIKYRWKIGKLSWLPKKNLV